MSAKSVAAVEASDGGRRFSKDTDETEGSESSTDSEPRSIENAASGSGAANTCKKSVGRAKFAEGNNGVSDVSDSMTSTISAEPIAEPVVRVGLDQLRYGFYRDLRTLVPPFADELINGTTTTTTGRSVDGMLRKMHDAIDEIDRMLDEVNLPSPITSECGNNGVAGRAPGTHDVAATGDNRLACANSPLKVSRPKPDAGIAMKTYRVKDDADRTADDQSK